MAKLASAPRLELPVSVASDDAPSPESVRMDSVEKVKWRVASEASLSLVSSDSPQRNSAYKKKAETVDMGPTRPCPPPHPFFPVDQNFNKQDRQRHSHGSSHHHHHLGIHRKHGSKLPSIARSRLYHSLSSLDKKGKLWSKFYADDDENIKKVLDAVAGDHLVFTDPADNKNRRTIVIERGENEKFGFTIQSYTFKNTRSQSLEKLSYVDNVELNGPAHFAGLRRGDVILSINGESVRDRGHEEVVLYVNQCLSMRMVVLFEDCAQKIDLFSRSIKLQKLLHDKEFELRILDLQENRLVQGLPLLSNDETLSYLRSSAASSPALSLDSKSFSIPSDWCLETAEDEQEFQVDIAINEIPEDDEEKQLDSFGSSAPPQAVVSVDGACIDSEPEDPGYVEITRL